MKLPFFYRVVFYDHDSCPDRMDYHEENSAESGDCMQIENDVPEVIHHHSGTGRITNETQPEKIEMPCF